MPQPFIALVMVDGKPAVLVAECVRDRVRSVWVAEKVRGIPLEERPQWGVSAPPDPAPSGTRTTTAVVVPARMTLLETPSGWTKDPDQAEGVREFREEAVYHLGADMAPPAQGLDFTLGLLRDLPSGAVLAGARSNRQHVMPETQWQEAAEASCRKTS